MKRSISSADRYFIESAILYAVRLGYDFRAAAAVGRIHRATLYRWLATDPELAARFAKAWAAGKERRTFRRWVTHPFRGFRPPSGKRTRDFPRYGRPRTSR